MKALILALVLTVFTCQCAVADKIHLKSGESMEARIVNETEEYIFIKNELGISTLILKKDVERIEYIAPDEITVVAYMEGRIKGQEKERVRKEIQESAKYAGVRHNLGI